QRQQSLTDAIDLARFDLRLCTLQSVRESFVIKRLQQVIERVYVKRLQRILIERGDENDRLDLFWSNALEHVEPIHLRHLDVEKDQIRRERVDGFDRFASIATLVENLDLRIFFEQQAQIASRQRLVVDDQCSNLLGH